MKTYVIFLLIGYIVGLFICLIFIYKNSNKTVIKDNISYDRINSCYKASMYNCLNCTKNCAMHDASVRIDRMIDERS